MVWGTIVLLAAISSYFKGAMAGFTEADRLNMKDNVLKMFYHGYDSYIWHAFPGDELKPLSRSATNSLGELGNLDLEHLTGSYKGVALTLIDSLPTLLALRNYTEFAKNLQWATDNLSFDQDVRVNVFEANIRLLGGLLSAHLLAEEAATKGLLPRGVLYSGQLLRLAQDLGKRLMPAFDSSPTGLPFAWVNLRHGVRPGEVTDTNTAGCGTLLIEFGILSRLTDNPRFEAAALRAVRALFSMRTSRGLVGTSLDMAGLRWIDNNGGVGPGADSFYEYLLKAYLLFGDARYWAMFSQLYVPALQHYRLTQQGWYTDADIFTGQPMHMQFQSLQAFWPGLQSLAGDVHLAAQTFWSFFSVWRRYGLLPERYLLQSGQVHPTEYYYPLRPELAESAFYMHQATGDSSYREAGRAMYLGLMQHARVEGGFANVRNVATKQLEDHMSSFFLAETCMYLYLLFEPEFLAGGNYMFTTEGHPIPISERLQRHTHRPGWPLGNEAGIEREPGDSWGFGWLQDPPSPLLAPMAKRLDGDGCESEEEEDEYEDDGDDEGCGGEQAEEEEEEEGEEAFDVWSLFPTYSHRSQQQGSRGSAAAAPQHGAPASALGARQCLNAAALASSGDSDVSDRGGSCAGGCRPLRSLCHAPDFYPDHTCHVHEDCGVDHETCVRRTCSAHKYCVGPKP